MEKQKKPSLVVHRLGMDLQRDHDYIDSFIKAAKANPGSLDEVWLATDYGYPPLEKCKAHGLELVKIKEKFEAAGVLVSM